MRATRFMLTTAVWACFLWSGGVPLRADEPKANVSLAHATRSLRPGIFLVGAEKVGHGTAWVISRKHRLLATNAHVADMFFKARPGQFKAKMNGSETVYGVDRVWFHPGVQRYPTRDENLAIRSANAHLGPVCPLGPDVAVMQLSAQGPELPVELSMASPDVVFDLQALPVAILGFPGHDTLAWEKVRRAQATFHEGTISRVTDFKLDGGASTEQAQCLQYSMQGFGGFSGSPIYLASGHVVGLHNMSRSADQKASRKIAHGVRIDSLWELLHHHRLVDKVPVPLSAQKLLLQRWIDPDPNLAIYKQVNKLVQEAEFHCFSALEPWKAIDKCNEAIKIYPRYGLAYLIRSYAHNNFYVQLGSSNKDRLKHLEKALDDYNSFKALTPPDRVLINDHRQGASLQINLSFATNNRKLCLEAVNTLDRILALRDINNFDRAGALSSKGSCLSFLSLHDQAVAAYNESLQLAPDNPVLWQNRKRYWEGRNRTDLAEIDRQMAENLRKKSILLDRTGHKQKQIVLSRKDWLTADEYKNGRGAYQKVIGVKLEAGYFYQFDLSNTQFHVKKDLDPILRLADPDGTLLAEDDDGGGYPHARIFHTPSKSGEFRLAVTSYQVGQTGPFVITVTRIAKDE